VAVSDPTSARLVRGYDAANARDFSPRLSVGTESRVVVQLDEAAAGHGKLEAELLLVEREERTKAEVLRVAPDRFEIRFWPSSPGEHALTVRHNGFPLSFSPLRGWAGAGPEGALNGNANGVSSPPINGMAAGVGKVRLTGVGLVRATVGEANYFVVDGSKAAPGGGAPKVVLETLEGTEVPVQLRMLAHDVYEAAYSPKYPGSYQLNVTWAGRLIKGCPLNITAEDVSSAAVGNSSAATRVFCSGEGLRAGTLGKDICSFIDTRKAGPGELSLHCVGPKGKTAYCELNDHQDGTFTLNLKPQEAGRHQLSIKYGGQHVKGSPFPVRVSSAPDPDKVKVYGPGVEHGVLAIYQSRFICDTRGAGAGQLTVSY